MNTFANMSEAYRHIAHKLINEPAYETTTRKGEKLRELTYFQFTLLDPMQCLAFCRPDFSLRYVQNEFDFYCSGSDRLTDALALSKFWSKCTDDGETINSNYGKLLFHDRNSHGNTQIEHVIAALRNNPESKKAVAVLHTDRHSYLSNDNPCTMFLHFRITLYKSSRLLHMRAHMRSNDVWFGTVYDVPFFCAVQNAVALALRDTYANLELGTYSHYACSLHCYERNTAALERMLSSSPESDKRPEYAACVKELFEKVRVALCGEGSKSRRLMSEGMAAAWKASEESNCLKKKCGAALVDEQGTIVATGYGGRKGNKQCSECNRDKKSDASVFYGDGCWSIHAEMRAVMEALYKGLGLCELSKCTMYVTHGPCDACMKLLDYVGILNVVYDVPYKTNYAENWPTMNVTREARTEEENSKPKSAWAQRTCIRIPQNAACMRLPLAERPTCHSCPERRECP